jgi:hypothetical protein
VRERRELRQKLDGKFLSSFLFKLSWRSYWHKKRREEFLFPLLRKPVEGGRRRWRRRSLIN